jgi:O-antigen/teichoic acid export membrane protein
MPVAQIQEMWQKLNANERTAATGAIVVIVAWLVAVVSFFGIGAGTITLLGALALLVIYYLKYSPSQSMTWPIPIPTITLGISVIIAILAILGLLAGLGLGLLFYGGLYLIGEIGIVVGAVLMVLGTWREYQLAPKTPSAPPPPPPPPPAA